MLNKENCVLCGKSTSESKDKPVKERKYYIAGSGQLCRECYERTYNKTKN